MPNRNMTSTEATDADALPSRGYGPFVPVSDHDVNVFHEILDDEVDSVFGSSICCCDFCYEEFKARWPDVAFREAEFTEQSFEVSWMLETSRLADLYPAAESSTLRRFLTCPRCQKTEFYNLWVYEHRFSDADEIEEAIDELLIIGQRTPFLMLQHDFAKRTLLAIEQLAKQTEPSRLTTSLYRARTSSDLARLSQRPDNIVTFRPPSAAFVGEGRFNHAGSPMLYLATAPIIAAAELGSPGEECVVGELKLKGAYRVLEIASIEEQPGYELLKALASSALLMAPRTGEGWVKRQYIFSRFVGDCARSAGFDAIHYGSTKLLQGSNYVFLDPPGFEEEISLVGTQKVVIPEPAYRY